MVPEDHGSENKDFFGLSYGIFGCNKLNQNNIYIFGLYLSDMKINDCFQDKQINLTFKMPKEQLQSTITASCFIDIELLPLTWSAVKQQLMLIC